MSLKRYKIMREIIDLNYNWLFIKDHLDEYIKDYNNIQGFEKVDIPHNAVDIPFHYFNESEFHIDCTYKKELLIKEEWQGKIINIIFEGVSNIAHIFINDEYVTTHKGGYTRFKVNLSDYVKYGQVNMLTVYVDSHENVFVPPFGGVIDYLSYSGIYREVSLEILDDIHIDDCFVRTYDPVNSSLVNFSIDVTTDTGVLAISVFDQDEEVNNTKVIINNKHMDVKLDIYKKVLWDLDNPYLYKAVIKLYQDEKLYDEYSVRFAFREVKFTSDGFYLNQKKIKLIGLNRHQSYPYVGYAMPKNIQIEDADILKYDLGVNIVRTSHYLQSQHFLDRCDEIGLLVFEEIPGWQHIGNSEWKELTYRNVREMVLRDRNHPSIVLWGVRINESEDNHNFYQETNRIAHMLDDTRPTGGVRNIPHSQFLEDVYTFNDFTHNGSNQALAKKTKITKKKHPYLVTEFNGHMFPTKRYDDENKRVEHALRHLRIINSACDPKNGISGAIGWCMNDYNTHQEFGSGDLVCYHGVLDMFRIPKLASYVYSSQQDNHPVLELSSYMHIGDCPSGIIDRVYAFTNCDYIKLYRNNEYVKTFYPAREEYPNLKHPPIIIDDFIGDLFETNEGFSKHDAKMIKKVLKVASRKGANLPFFSKLIVFYLLKKYRLSYEDGVKLFYKYLGTWGTKNNSFRFEGYINNEVVKVVNRESDTEFNYVLEMNRKTLEIGATYDALRVVVKKVNQNGDLLPYSFDPLRIKVTGVLDLIGPDTISLQGGAMAFWVKTNGTKGIGTITVTGDKTVMETIMVK